MPKNFFADYGAYPSTGNSWYGVSSVYGSMTTSGATGYIPNLAPKYVNILPVDPLGGIGLLGLPCDYLYKSDGVHYKLLSHCAAEGVMLVNDSFYDSACATWAWKVTDDPVTTAAW